MLNLISSFPFLISSFPFLISSFLLLVVPLSFAFGACFSWAPEEVGHGHVTYVRKLIHAVSLALYMAVPVLKKRSEFSRYFFRLPQRNWLSFESASGVESEYPVNPVQPLGHFGCMAA